MSTAAPASTAFPLNFTVSNVERVFWRSALLMGLILLAFKGAHFLEREVFHLASGERFVREASHTSSRYFLLPHFAIAFLFAVTSRRNQSWQRRSRMGWLFVVGLGLCVLFKWLGDVIPAPKMARHFGESNFGMLVLVYGYFMVHDFRDQAFFYRTLGDAPPDASADELQSFTNGIIALYVSAAALVLWAVLVIGTPSNVSDVLPQITAPWLRMLIGVGGLPIWLAMAAWSYARQSAERKTTWLGLMRRHAPLLRLYGAELSVLGIAFAVTGRPYPILLMHCCAWYVFSCHQYAQRPAPPAAGVWQWMRTSLSGFRTLHHGAVAALILVGVGVTYGLGWPQMITDQTMLYLSILHITTSFMPR